MNSLVYFASLVLPMSAFASSESHLVRYKRQMMPRPDMNFFPNPQQQQQIPLQVQQPASPFPMNPDMPFPPPAGLPVPGFPQPNVDIYRQSIYPGGPGDAFLPGRMPLSVPQNPYGSPPSSNAPMIVPQSAPSSRYYGSRQPPPSAPNYSPYSSPRSSYYSNSRFQGQVCDSDLTYFWTFEPQQEPVRQQMAPGTFCSTGPGREIYTCSPSTCPQEYQQCRASGACRALNDPTVQGVNYRGFIPQGVCPVGAYQSCDPVEPNVFWECPQGTNRALPEKRTTGPGTKCCPAAGGRIIPGHLNQECPAP